MNNIFLRLLISIPLFLFLLPTILTLRCIGRVIDVLIIIREKKRIKELRDKLDYYRAGEVSKASSFVQREVEYKRDYMFTLLDYQQWPVATLLRGNGDCEDLASLYKYLIGKGKRCRMFAAFALGKQGHVMLAVEERKGVYYICSNTETNVVSAKSWNEAYDKGAKEWFKDGEYLCTVSYIPWIDVPYLLNAK